MKRIVSDADMSFVVQGPVVKNCGKTDKCTYQLLKSIRKFFPKAQIVLSTWKGEDVSGLEYDVLVQSEQPEAVQIYYSEQLHLFTVNHQILSTCEGLKKADRKYAVKVRSDLIFLNPNILKYAGKYRGCDNKHSEWRLFTERVITLPTYNFRRGMSFPFSVADWIYAGLKTDLLDFFDIPMLDMKGLIIRNGEDYPYLSDNIGAEQYYCVSFIRKHISEFGFWGWESTEKKYQRISEVFYGQNFVFLPAEKMGIKSQKTGFAGYCAKPSLSSGLYTYSEWKRLYNRFGGGNLRLIYNPAEDFGYSVIFGMRRFLSTHCKGIYKACVKAIRKTRR